MPITLIYTQTEKWLISREHVDWRIWQDKLYWFMTSLPFEDITSCAGFLQKDFHLTGIQSRYIIDTVSQSDSKTFELYIARDNDVKIIPLQLDLLHSKGQAIDWLDWAYFFTKRDDSYDLWVYLGGIAEQVREIKLSDLQVKHWRDQGNQYIKQLAAELQYKNSQSYSDAINENRKLL